MLALAIAAAVGGILFLPAKQCLSRPISGDPSRCGRLPDGSPERSLIGPQRVVAERNRVLDRMTLNQAITQEERARAADSPLAVVDGRCDREVRTSAR